MKRGTLVIGIVVVSCFFAGIFLADNVRLNKQMEQLSIAPQANATDLMGMPSPDFSLMDMSGQLRNVSEWQDKVLVINFWATWCPPCREEIPHFINLQDKYGHQGLQFLGIALEDAEDVMSFANELGINYPLLVGEQEVIKLAGKFGNRIGGLPYTVILDRDGNINFIKTVTLSALEAEQVITSLL